MPRIKKTESIKEYSAMSEDDVKYALEIPVKQVKYEDLVKIEKKGNKKTRIGRLKSRKIEEEFKEREIEEPVKKIDRSKGDYILIITEKPQAALKIASALGSPRKLSDNSVPYYELTRENKKIVVACAVGHLFSLAQDNGKKSDFPVFDISWKPNSEVKKKDWSKKYFNVLKKLCKKASSFIVATDYDIEGEVIGLNIIRYICKEEDASRMKFSTLTKNELEKAYENTLPTLDWGQGIAGETRHYLDWMYGINLSRALMAAIKSTGKFRIMSVGRVQGPALKLIVDRELEIQAFKPEPFWNIYIKLKGHKPELKYEKDIKSKPDLDKFKNLKGEQGTTTTDKKTRNLPPPYPFDLTSLQREIYRLYKINPSRTLQLAQNLYLAGLISYPRTSSQKIPPEIQPQNILKKLKTKFKETKYAIRKNPIEGKKSDPAHPSIFPTGEDGVINEDEKKVYNIIAKRFISCFCEDAIIEDKKIVFITEKDKLKFIVRGLEIKDKGWMNVYPAVIKEQEVEDIGGKKQIEKSKIEERETQPPRRFSPASIITELEKRDLGTKCLTGDTKVIFNGNSLMMKEIFENADLLSKEKDLETRRIKGVTISLNKNNEIVKTNPKVISKRKLKEDEKVIKIDTDFSSITLTEDHLLYCIKNNRITNIPANKCNIDDNLIGILKEHSEGKIIIDKDNFNDKFAIKNNEICHKFSSKKSRGVDIRKLPIRWSASLAWILGYYYGDGSYSNPRYNGSHQVYFTTTEKKALELLKHNIKDVFGVEPYCYELKRKYKVNCNCSIAYALIQAFPKIEGKKPFKIPEEFRGDFLRGFFDADGNVHLRPLGKTKIKGVECNSFDTPRIKITLARKDLIEWISRMLNGLGIENKFNKNNSLCRGKRFNCWTILIGNRDRIEKFAYKIGFDSYKEDTLYKGLKCNSIKYNILFNSAKIYFALIKEELKPEELVEKIGISRYLVIRAIKHLFALGLISKKRIGNRDKQKWVYSSKGKDIKYENYCIKLINEKIEKNMYKIPVRGIKEVNYKGDVYDISVDKDSPNFIVEGNILVHNSTRASILETLYNRNYVKEQAIQATPLGISLIKSLEKYSPVIIDEKLTRHFEKEMEAIQKAKKNLSNLKDITLKEAKKAIIKISEDFKKNEKKIGKELVKATEEHWKQEREDSVIGKCPKCKEGQLRMLYNRNYKRYFIGCNAYPECKTTFSLPPGTIKKTDKLCEKCSSPMLMSLKKGKKPWFFCFNPECETNKQRIEEYRKKKEQENNKE